MHHHPSDSLIVARLFDLPILSYLTTYDALAACEMAVK